MKRETADNQTWQVQGSAAEPYTVMYAQHQLTVNNAYKRHIKHWHKSIQPKQL